MLMVISNLTFHQAKESHYEYRRGFLLFKCDITGPLRLVNLVFLIRGKRALYHREVLETKHLGSEFTCGIDKLNH